MTNKKQINLWFYVSLVFVFFCLLGCRGQKTEKILITESFPDQMVKNFTMDKYESELHRWSFFATRGELYEKRKTINAKNIKVNFYESNEKIGSVVSANKATIKTDIGNIRVDGNVIIFSLLKNTTIFTEALNYDEKSGRVFTDLPVRQEKANITLTGIGLEANSDLSNITILKDVKVTKK